MADNVSFQLTPATPASGTVVSTEEVTNLNGAVVSAQHVQRVAAAIRTADGTAVDLSGDSAQGLDVDVTRLPSLPAGNNNIGDVDIASLPNEGQQNMAGSISVAVASDQSAIPVTDNGGSLTVDGPLTDAQLRATAIPVSGTLGVSGNVEVTNDTGNPLPVSASSLPLPTGAATLAEQQTQTTSLQLIDDVVYADGTGTPSKAIGIAGTDGTNPQIIKTDAAGELQVDVLTLPNVTVGTALPAGTNNIGDIDILTLPAIPTGDNSIGRVKITDGTDVADVLDLTNSNPLATAIVDAAGNQITSFGGGTQYDEDTASAAADKLTMAGVVRKDSAASLVDTDGDRTQLQVDAVGALRVTGGGGGTEYTEDTAAPADPVGNQLMARRRDSLATETTTDGDVTALNATAKGELHVKHADPVTVSNVATATNQSTQTSILTATRDAAEILDNVVVMDDSPFSPGATSVSMAGAEFDDVAPDSVDEGDAGALRMSANRNLYTQIRDAAGNERGVNVTATNALSVDALATTNQTANGTLTAAAQTVSIPVNGVGTLGLQITGTWTGTLIFEGTVDDTNYFTIRSFRYSDQAAATSTTANGQWSIPVAGLKRFRVRASILSSGTANVFMEGSQGTAHATVLQNLPINIAQIGGSAPDVQGGNIGAGTQRIVLATDQPQLTNALKVDGSAVTQPVSGTITANAGTNLNTSALNLEATQAAVKTAVELIDDAVYTDGTGTPSKAIGIAGTDGTNPQIVKTDANGELQVDVLSLPNEGQQTMANSISVVVASDQSVVPTAPVQTVASNLKSQVQGEAAHDATIAGNPVVVGGRSNNAVPAAVSADGEAVWAWLLRTGAQMVANAPHLGMLSDPFNLTFKCAQYTTTQTGVALWTPAAGKKIVIVSIQIQAGGTTAGTLQVWFGASADTTYTRGTDAAIFDGEFAPSSTLKPGFAQTGLWISPTADHILRVTDSAAINPLTITVWGYEV